MNHRISYTFVVDTAWSIIPNTQHINILPYLFCGEQGLVRYWHIGNKRNANAIVARTEERNKHSSETWTVCSNSFLSV